MKQQAMSSSAINGPSQDPQAAMTHAQNSPNGRAKNNLISTIAQQMAQQDPEAA